MSTFDMASLVFIFAALIGIVNERYFRWPRVITLLICALAASLVIMAIGRYFTSFNLEQRAENRIEGAHLPRILLDGVLALLLFAASLHVNLRELKSQAWAVFGLATAGVMVATVLLGFGIFGADGQREGKQRGKCRAPHKVYVTKKHRCNLLQNRQDFQD